MSVAKDAAAGTGSAASSSTPAQVEVDPANDAACLQSVLATLPGVDPNDPQIMAILQQFQQQQQQKK